MPPDKGKGKANMPLADDDHNSDHDADDKLGIPLQAPESTSQRRLHSREPSPRADDREQHSMTPRDRLPIRTSVFQSTAVISPQPLSPAATMASPYLPLLHCPACSPSDLLTAPTSLHCGHTVCSTHVRKPLHPPASSSTSSAPTPLSRRPSRQQQLPARNTPPVPSCPLPTCRHTSNREPRSANIPSIPPESPVAYYPPPSAHTKSDADLITVENPRIDVSVSRILVLMRRTEYAQVETETDFAPTRGENGEDDTDDDDEDEDSQSQGPPRRQDDDSGTPLARSNLPVHEPGRASTPLSAERRLYSNRDSPPSVHARPHKRQRRQTIHPPIIHPLPADREEPFNKELMEHLTCEICFMLLFQPVTTPCQHTFCAKCLQRSLDHATKCPLCRQDLPAFSYFQDHPFNKVILSLILKAFPDVYDERGRVIEAEERDARLDTPIFVCQLSFPGMPTLLHFFEPRYRLMLRRCLESPTPCFGMIMPPRANAVGSSNDFGTMLEIRSVQMLPDGRSMVETWGSYRFRILERGSLDGYMVGRIERIDDVPPELEDEAERSLTTALASEPNTRRGSPAPTTASSSSAPSRLSNLIRTPSPGAHTAHATNEELLAVCHAFLDQLRNGTAPWVVQRLNNTYGPMPTDPSSFSFWMALVLPIEEQEKAKLLPIKSPRLRLRLVVHWIEQLNSNWWFSSGCTIS